MKAALERFVYSVSSALFKRLNRLSIERLENEKKLQPSFSIWAECIKERRSNDADFN